MPTSFALRATTKSWRAANRAGAISCGASHSRVKSACKPTHSPTCNSPNHRRRPSRDGPPRSQHCVLSPLRQDTNARLRRDTIMYCVKGVNQKSFVGSEAVAVRTPVRTSPCLSFVLWIVSGGVPARRQGPSGRSCRIRAGRRVGHHCLEVCAVVDSAFGRCPYMTSACLSAKSFVLL